MQRWAILLSAYSYTLEYRSSKDVSNADALSRLPSDEEGLEKSVDRSVLLMTASNIPLTSKQIAEATRKDPILSQVFQALQHNTKLTDEDFRPYISVWNELNTEDGCVLRSSRVVIPHSLTSQVLKEVHIDHPGIVRTKALLRSYVWWPNIDQDIVASIRNCHACMERRNATGYIRSSRRISCFCKKDFTTTYCKRIPPDRLTYK